MLDATIPYGPATDGRPPIREPVESDLPLVSGLAGRFRAAFLMTALAGLLLSGCATVKTAVPSVTYVSPEAALGALTLPVPSPALAATARIEILARSERYPLKAALILKEPASLRMESIPLLGPPDFFLTVNDGQLRAYLPPKGTFYVGPAPSRPLTLPPPCLASSRNRLPDLGHAPGKSLRPDGLAGGEEEGLYPRGPDRPGHKDPFPLDRSGRGRLMKVRTFAADGGILYTAEFDEHIRIGNAWIPRRLVIAGQDGSVRVSYTDIAPLDDDADVFVLPIPEGISPTPLD